MSVSVNECVCVCVCVCACCLCVEGAFMSSSNVSGHPIVNDPLYNSPSWGPLRGKGGHCDVSHEEVGRLTRPNTCNFNHLLPIEMFGKGSDETIQVG